MEKEESAFKGNVSIKPRKNIIRYVALSITVCEIVQFLIVLVLLYNQHSKGRLTVQMKCILKASCLFTRMQLTLELPSAHFSKFSRGPC